MAEFYIYAAAFILTAAGVKIFTVWSLRRNVLDVPNERSSHTRPTPRGGGLIIVIVALGLYLFYTILLTRNFLWQYAVGAILIAAVSWLDDLYSLSFGWRILVHAAAALFIAQSLNQALFFDSGLPYNAWLRIGVLLAVILWIVWLTNAYNFMDGIDGIAGVQAVSAGIGWLLFGKFFQTNSTTEVYGGILAFSAAAFLIYNWRPAKVFMGDVGSAFLGFSFASLPIFLVVENPSNWKSALVVGVGLIWLFFFDTIHTLLQRIWRREKFWQAHRSHIYQQLVVNGLTHPFVAGLYGTLSFFNAFLIIAASWFGRGAAYIVVVILIVQAIGLLIFLRSIKKSSVKAPL